MDSNIDEPDNRDSKHYIVPYSIDSDRFFRLQCSACDREFKVLVDAISEADRLGPAFKQIERESHVTLSTATENTDLSANSLTCPYCGNRDKQANLNTREFIDYAVRWINREVVYDLLNDLSHKLGNIFNNNRTRGSGSISITWEYKHQASPKPILPITGPELPDMKKVELSCCCKIIKVADAWDLSIFCPYCSLELELQ